MYFVTTIDKKLPYAQEHVNIGNNKSQSYYRMKHGVLAWLLLDFTCTDLRKDAKRITKQSYIIKDVLIRKAGCKYRKSVRTFPFFSYFYNK